jgi:hypothetical protein
MGFPEVMDPKECILFLSHHTQPGAMAALAKLRDECGASFAVVPVFDWTREAFSLAGIEGAASVTFEQVAALLPYRKKYKQHPGTFWPRNIDLPLMWYFHEHPGFDHYWVMEYDVRFTGHWMELFGHFATSRSDLLATTLFDFDFRPTWDNWKTLKSPRRIADRELVRALFPLYRLSNTALQALHRAYCDGWSGHYEVTIPTILKAGGFALEDFGGSGGYVAAGNYNRFYRNSPDIAGLAPGTFTVTANQISPAYPPNLLWHPIKG